MTTAVRRGFSLRTNGTYGMYDCTCIGMRVTSVKERLKGTAKGKAKGKVKAEGKGKRKG